MLRGQGGREWAGKGAWALAAAVAAASPLTARADRHALLVDTSAGVLDRAATHDHAILVVQLFTAWTRGEPATVARMPHLEEVYRATNETVPCEELPPALRVAGLDRRATVAEPGARCPVHRLVEGRERRRARRLFAAEVPPGRGQTAIWEYGGALSAFLAARPSRPLLNVALSLISMDDRVRGDRTRVAVVGMGQHGDPWDPEPPPALERATYFRLGDGPTPPGMTVVPLVVPGVVHGLCAFLQEGRAKDCQPARVSAADRGATVVLSTGSDGGRLALVAEAELGLAPGTAAVEGRVGRFRWAIVEVGRVTSEDPFRLAVASARVEGAFLHFPEMTPSVRVEGRCPASDPSSPCLVRAWVDAIRGDLGAPWSLAEVMERFDLEVEVDGEPRSWTESEPFELRVELAAPAPAWHEATVSVRPSGGGEAVTETARFARAAAFHLGEVRAGRRPVCAEVPRGAEVAPSRLEAALATTPHGAFRVWVETPDAAGVGRDGGRVCGSGPAWAREGPFALSIDRLEPPDGVPTSLTARLEPDESLPVVVLALFAISAIVGLLLVPRPPRSARVTHLACHRWPARNGEAPEWAATPLPEEGVIRISALVGGPGAGSRSLERLEGRPVLGPGEPVVVLYPGTEPVLVAGSVKVVPGLVLVLESWVVGFVPEQQVDGLAGPSPVIGLPDESTVAAARASKSRPAPPPPRSPGLSSTAAALGGSTMSALVGALVPPAVHGWVPWAGTTVGFGAIAATVSALLVAGTALALRRIRGSRRAGPA